MKHIINQSGGVTTYIESTPLTNPQHLGWMHIKIYTTAEFSRDPDYEQLKLDLCLDPEDFANLKATINSL